MKLNRQKLIENVDQALKTQQSIEDQYDELLKEKQEEHRKAWFVANSEYWRNFVARLDGKLDRGEPIRVSDMPEKYPYNERDNVFYSNYAPTRERHAQPHQLGVEPIGPRPTAQVRELKALKSFLESIDDELVSQAALERAGFRGLHSLFLLGESQIVD